MISLFPFQGKKDILPRHLVVRLIHEISIDLCKIKYKCCLVQVRNFKIYTMTWSYTRKEWKPVWDTGVS